MLVLALVSALILMPRAALAAGPYPPGISGNDISWPQCGGPYPGLGAGQFGIVGANDGVPESVNPCFASELAWAQQNAAYTGVYLNEAYGTSVDGPDSCEPADQACLAYNYGWMTAQYAFVTALVNSGGAADNVHAWWLDVEVANTWSPDPSLDDQVIRGSIDYLQNVQGVEVGIYSVNDMWAQIAGSYAPAGIPNWIAGGADASDTGTCGRTLWPGAEPAIFQSLTPDGTYDVDVGC